MTTKQDVLAQLDALAQKSWLLGSRVTDLARRTAAVAEELTATQITTDSISDGFAALMVAVGDLAMPPEPDDYLLRVVPGFQIGAGDMPDREKLFAMFDIDNLAPSEQGFWANESSSIEVLPDGSFRVWFDKQRLGEGGQNTGGSSWCNAALPLIRPVKAARLSYRVDFDPVGLGWDHGTSGKMPGLMRWTAGRAPGGGIIGDGQHSERIAWNDWNRDGQAVRIGPYIYGQHLQIVPDQIWGPNRDTGTIRWGGPVTPELTEGQIPDRPLLIEEEVVAVGAGRAVITFKIDGVVRWSHEVQLVSTDQDVDLTHVSFGLMYGGNTPAYGPDQDVTCLEFSDFHVVAL